MERKNLNTQAFVIDAYSKYTDISINKTRKYVIYVNVFAGPKKCLFDHWDSSCCWFSHMFTTLLSRYLDNEAPFHVAYAATISIMVSRMRKAGYTEKEISDVTFNLICVIPSVRGVTVHYGGNDTFMLKSYNTPSIIVSSHTDALTVHSKPEMLDVVGVKSLTICNTKFAKCMLQNSIDFNDITQMHALCFDDIYAPMLRYRNDNKYDTAYYFAEVC